MCQMILAQTSTTLTVYHQKDGQYIKRGEIVGLPGTPEYIPSKNEVVDFKKKRDYLYQVKVRDERTGKIHLQSTRMCQMVAGNWSDEFILHLDDNNHFYHFDYYAGSNACPDIEYPVQTQPFSSTIRVAKAVPGPKPLVGNFAQQKPQQAKSKKPVAQVNDEIPENKEIEEKTFFQKYWYLILGGAMLLMSASGAPPEGNAPARR
ncbi:uncharacterized protein B0P05DRAFT_587615 [Gilbertella persicaria]|uniref:uncharacterized protein n=1 Tax=Gilbertella persicaria TaxID=101096 RepID=UPI00221F7F52|nr:uncharacterized protein B0P05DRAFT_587615 [Gilbertella persicaria]KAI8077999.1 hypothetical protein B0P05DRAFT_587615 [Gilbertella persicaria]